MAKKKPSILGEPRGKVGDVVYKERNGKMYVSRAATTYTLSQLPHEINKRGRQKVNGKFASIINSNILLKSIWYKEKGSCENAFNRINQVNYPLCETDHPSEKAIITPPGGFSLEVEDITIFPDRIEIIPRPIKQRKEETEIRYIMIVSLWNPKRKSKTTALFEFLLLEQYITEGSTQIFRLDKENITLAKKYKSRTVFLAAVTLDEENKILRWAETPGRDYQINNGPAGI